MIEKMQKLSVLMLRSDSEDFLEELQDIGIVHLEQEYFADNEGVCELQDSIITLKKIEQSLAEYHETEFDHEPHKCADVDELCTEVNKLVEELTHLHVQKETLHKQIQSLTPWGEFDPDLIKKLEGEGVFFKYFTVNKAKFNSLDLSEYNMQIINEEHGVVYFIIIYSTEEEVAGLTLSEELLVLRSLAEVERELEETGFAIKHRDSLLGGLFKQKHLIDVQITEYEDQKEFLLASLNLKAEADGQIMQLSGYVPQSGLQKVTDFMEAEDVVYLLEEPDDVVATPIKLKNRKVSSLFEPITKMYGFPKYTEIDTTPFFAPFFALFFGVCLADLGYGGIILVLSLFITLFSKKASIKPFAKLGIILGGMTMVGGILLNTFFGVKINGITGLSSEITKYIPFTEQNDGMGFAIMLGVIQMLFGFVLQMINRARDNGFKGILLPLATIFILSGVMIFAVGSMGIDAKIGTIPIGKIMFVFQDPERVGIVAAGLGVLLLFVIAFIGTPLKKIFLSPIKFIGSIYNVGVGLLGDTLSYIRLFALGLSGGLLGAAMNEIAMMVRGDEPNIVTFFFMIVILIFGHTLNFGLAALGAFVHPLRLTFVEFYKAVGFSGGGKAYKPFMKKLAINGGEK